MKALLFCDDETQDEEFLYPKYRLQEAGFAVDVCSTSKKSNPLDVKGKYGIPFKPNISSITLRHGTPDNEYDIIIVPGGWGAERIRMDKDAVDFIKRAHTTGTPIGFICHGPWVAITAGICDGRRMTCYVGMKDDLINAGGIYIDEPVVIDYNIVTAPHYRNNPEFMREILKLYNQAKALREYAVH